MAIEMVKEILEKLASDPKAQDLLKGLEQPKSEIDKIDRIVEAAKQLGYDMNQKDLLAYIEKTVADRKEKTEAQAEAVQKLADSELEKAAGGRGHYECEYTFTDKENCWWHDACDLNHLMYDNYICNHNHNGRMCLDQAMMDCQELLF